jgi:hypothetical protein
MLALAETDAVKGGEKQTMSGIAMHGIFSFQAVDFAW